MSEMRRYILFNKPFGVLTQFTDHAASPRPTLKDFIPVPDVYAVGRLDVDSEGLLLLTNDGALQHQLSDPKFDHPKTYWVQVEGEPDEEAVRRLSEGLVIQSYRTRPAKVRVFSTPPETPPRDPAIRFRKDLPTTWMELVLTEGRNRQVRRMTAAVGFPTLRLIRVALGSLRVEGLAPGAWREMSIHEINALRRGSHI